jgi:hypothetical protein
MPLHQQCHAIPVAAAALMRPPEVQCPPGVPFGSLHIAAGRLQHAMSRANQDSRLLPLQDVIVPAEAVQC